MSVESIDPRARAKRGNIETTLELISIDAIDFNDKSFRFRLDLPHEELNQLTTSIKKLGLQNPVKLRKKGDRYQIISGWSRLQALKKLGHLKAFSEVYRNITDRHAIMIASSENIHRSNLSDARARRFYPCWTCYYLPPLLIIDER